MSSCEHDFADTHLQGHKVCLKCHLTFNPRELELMARVAELEKALENIAEGTTEWVDGYHDDLSGCLMAYAKQVLGVSDD
jgi:hypothetical protein